MPDISSYISFGVKNKRTHTHMDLNGRRQCNLYFACNRFVRLCDQTAFQTVLRFILKFVPFTCQDWEVGVGTLLVVTCYHPMQAQQGHQGLQFLAALNRFERLIVLRQHIRESILAFDEVSAEFETHPDLHDVQMATHITTMRLHLHNLCQRVTQAIAAQQTEPESFIPTW